MAAGGDTFNNKLMLLFFNATAWGNVADNAATSPITSWQLSLHTATLSSSNNQTTSEATYTSYARVAVARTSGGFTVTTNTVNPASNINFPAGTGGSGTVSAMGLGTASSGVGVLELFGTVSPNIVTGSGVTPQLTTSTAWSIT